MKSKIVVDSSANVYELPDVGFACVPLKILTGEQEYVDNAEVDAPALAEMLRTYKGRTSTSCPCGVSMTTVERSFSVEAFGSHAL